jgi:hypothetical protein
MSRSIYSYPKEWPRGDSQNFASSISSTKENPISEAYRIDWQEILRQDNANSVVENAQRICSHPLAPDIFRLTVSSRTPKPGAQSSCGSDRRWQTTY